MANTLLVAAVTFCVISVLFLIAIVQNAVDERTLIATPNISRQHAVLTSFACVGVKASPDEAFAVVSDFKGYDKWSTFCYQYKWDKVTVDGFPIVGSSGTHKLDIEDFAQRTIPVKLSMLDRKRRKIAERTVGYPPWLLGYERVQEIVPVEGNPGACEYRTYQTIQGIGAYYLLLTARIDLAETQSTCAKSFQNFMENGKR